MQPLPRRNRFSIPGKLSLLFAGLLVLVASVAAAASHLGASPLLVFFLAVAVPLPVGLVVISWFWYPTQHILEALKDGVQGFRSGDFSLRLAVDRSDEVGQLVRMYNAVGDTLRAERNRIRQRELLLESALENSPAALLLVDELDHVRFANRAARQLFRAGKRLEGQSFTALAADCAPALTEALTAGRDSLIELTVDGNPETLHITGRQFTLDTQRHRLIMLRHLTPELRRQEATAYKTVFRAISHELQNALAPIVSMCSSGRRLRVRTGAGDERMDEVFDTIEECAESLRRYVDGYSQFSRLPAPRLQATSLVELVAQLQRMHPFRVEGEIPERTIQADPGQLKQAMLNLLKNAAEAGSPADETVLGCIPFGDGGVVLEIRDRGTGMDQETMASALIPFYSSKEGGTGLGLALCREIFEAHGGRLSLSAREGGGLVVTCRLPGAG